MPYQAYEIRISPDSVDAVEDSSKAWRDRSSVVRRAIAISATLLIGFAICMSSIGVFAHDGSNGPTIWQNLTSYRWPHHYFVEALVQSVFIGSLAVSSFFYGLRLFFPFGAMLHCNRSTFTVSRIPWFNLHGQWKTQSFPIGSIAEFRFVIYPSRNQKTYYRFRFRADGHKYKLFNGLTLGEARKILRGLKSLGLGVTEDPDMGFLIKADAEDRRSSLDYPRPPTRPGKG